MPKGMKTKQLGEENKEALFLLFQEKGILPYRELAPQFQALMGRPISSQTYTKYKKLFLGPQQPPPPPEPEDKLADVLNRINDLSDDDLKRVMRIVIGGVSAMVLQLRSTTAHAG